MKGIAHFASGICAATFIPGLVHAGAEGSVLIALAGAAALLPDLLDFRINRYLEHHDDEIELGTNERHLDPQTVADRIAQQMNAALVTGLPRTVQLHTLQRGPDLWQQYTVSFKNGPAQVIVRVGPTVNSVQQERAGTDVGTVGKALINGTIHTVYDERVTVDILSGPSLRFAPTLPHPMNTGNPVARTLFPERHLKVEFLPWHRRWSHSFSFAGSLGLLGWLLDNWQLGAVFFLGIAIHILQDQLGYMGSNLFWPFSHNRLGGLRLFHSDHLFANSATVWTACALVLWNLDRFSNTPLIDEPSFWICLIALPILGLFTLDRWEKKSGPCQNQRTYSESSDTQVDG